MDTLLHIHAGEHLAGLIVARVGFQILILVVRKMAPSIAENLPAPFRRMRAC